MSSYVPVALRRLVATRASGLCEYCLVHEDDTFYDSQIEHVISEKHGGATTPENLALACIFCNLYKGTDIATLLPDGRLCRLYNPRADRWTDHFAIAGAEILALSDIARATSALLRFNVPDRIDERMQLARIGRYPSPEARTIVGV